MSGAEDFKNLDEEFKYTLWSSYAVTGGTKNYSQWCDEIEEYA